MTHQFGQESVLQVSEDESRTFKRELAGVSREPIFADCPDRGAVFRGAGRDGRVRVAVTWLFGRSRQGGERDDHAGRAGDSGSRGVSRRSRADCVQVDVLIHSRDAGCRGGRGVQRVGHDPEVSPGCVPLCH